MRHVNRVLPWLRRAVAAEWQGPADLPRSLTIEWRLIAARWVGILAVAPALFVMHLPVERLIAAYSILVFAVVYNVSLRWFLPRRPAAFANGYVTTAADSVLNISMVLTAGGVDPPMGDLLFTPPISAG